MANDKTNRNELVADEDEPTAEFEKLALRKRSPYADDAQSESAADTLNLAGDDDRDASIPELKRTLQARAATINRQQYDIEQLRAKLIGLETELKAREQITVKLNDDLDDLRAGLQRKDKLIKKRDETNKALKAEIRERNAEYGRLNVALEQHRERMAMQPDDAPGSGHTDAQDARQRLDQQAGQIASAQMMIKKQQAHIDRSEAYADSLRRQLRDKKMATDEAERARVFLESSLARATRQLEEFKAVFEQERTKNAELGAALEELKEAHAEELRMVRFELGEAQETVAEHELISEQLASDLIDTRGFRDEIEEMYTKSEEESKSRIDQLERENRKLIREVADAKEKLEGKNEAITCLLAELAKQPGQTESIDEVEEVIQEIDDRVSERIDDRADRERDRLTRVLVGSVDGQELRFPLFKDRLTIGRTEQNDIQLKASFVSRRHAVIVTDQDATRVIDWGSKNGVFVNSKRITEHFLKNGDILKIGVARFRYEERRKRDS